MPKTNGELFLKKNNNKKNRKEEAQLLKACMQYLTLKGYLTIRNNTGLVVVSDESSRRAIRFGRAGSSDIIACAPGGQFVAIECKSSYGKVSKSQQEFLEKVRKLGGVALVVRNIDELIQFL